MNSSNSVIPWPVGGEFCKKTFHSSYHVVLALLIVLCIFIYLKLTVKSVSCPTHSPSAPPPPPKKKNNIKVKCIHIFTFNLDYYRTFHSVWVTAKRMARR